MHGKGEYHWPEGGEYIGDYVHNIKEGLGKFTWTNGRVYEGPFSQGRPHGSGKLFQNGKKFDVVFEYGKISKSKKKRDKTSSDNLGNNTSSNFDPSNVDNKVIAEESNEGDNAY